MQPVYTFRINQALLDELQDFCTNNDHSVSSVIRNSIFRYLREHQ
jgi:hypothetical protein